MKSALGISIIIPVYNVESYLPKCLDSVLAQSYTNLEIILIDDGSTDNSGKICDDYAKKDKRIKIIHKENGGVSSARNLGLKIAKGQYVGFVDSDDYIEKDMYEYLLALINNYKTDISVCAVIGEPILIKTKKPLILNSIKAFNYLYLQSYSVNKLFNADILKDINFREDISFCEDMLFCYSAFAKSKKIVYGPKAKYHYITNPKSATSRQIFSLKKLSYFKANNELLRLTKQNRQIVSYIKILQSRAYISCLFLRAMIENNFSDRTIINPLLKDLRKNIFLHLLGPSCLSNKSFAIIACINFNLARVLYRLINKALDKK